jgi:hypothetical protein
MGRIEVHDPAQVLAAANANEPEPTGRPANAEPEPVDARSRFAAQESWRTSIPSVLHPVRFAVAGIQFEVVTAEPVSDEQAAKIVMHFCKGRKFKKADQGKLIRVVTLFDRESASLLG